MNSNSDKLSSILRHIKRVEENCNLVATKLIEVNPAFSMAIAKRGRVHDASKLDPLEFQHLWSNDSKFEIALKNHHAGNTHHPEHFQNGIYGMSDLDLCEMVCDCVARSQEFGTDIRAWFFDEDKAPKRFGYKDDKNIYTKIESYLDLIINKPFKK
jgi:hypothetical protein